MTINPLLPDTVESVISSPLFQQQQQQPISQPQAPSPAPSSVFENPAFLQALGRMGGQLLAAGQGGANTALGVAGGLNTFNASLQNSQQQQFLRDRAALQDAISIGALQAQQSQGQQRALEAAREQEAIRVLSDPSSSQAEKTAAGLILNPASAAFASGIKTQQPLVNVNTGLGPAFDKVFTEQSAKEIAKINREFVSTTQRSAEAAQRILPKVQRTLSDLRSGKIRTGFGAEVQSSLKNFLVSAGAIDEDANLPAERLKALSANLVGQKAKQLGTNPTDRDVEFVLQGIATLGKTGAFNIEELEDMEREMLANIERARLAFQADDQISRGEFSGNVSTFVGQRMLDFQPPVSQAPAQQQLRGLPTREQLEQDDAAKEIRQRLRRGEISREEARRLLSGQ